MFERYFGYSNTSYMYKALNQTKNLEENKTQVNTIENKLNNLVKTIKNKPTNDVKKLKTEITC